MEAKTAPLFSKAVNEQGYLKCAIMGFPGSGKTFTASLIAIGLHKALKATKPVYALDSEKGFDYIVKRYDEEKIPLQVARTRAFTHLTAAIDQAEKEASILIVDSVTHFWQEIQESYKREHNRTQLRLQDWGPLKAAWSAFPNKFLNSNLHIIVCGRAGDDYEYQENEDSGKMEVYKSGTKMLAEKNLSYEPGLVVEMEKANKGQFKKGKRNMVNLAHILKDRYDVMDGRSYENPTFETFWPHIEQLNLGIHAGISAASSKELFDKDSDKNFYEKRKKIEIYKEEITGELTSAYPGRSAEEIKAKTDVFFKAFRTRSWAALDEKSPEELKAGLTAIRAELQKNQEPPKSNGGNKEKKPVATGGSRK